MIPNKEVQNNTSLYVISLEAKGLKDVCSGMEASLEPMG